MICSGSETRIQPGKEFWVHLSTDQDTFSMQMKKGKHRQHWVPGALGSHLCTPAQREAQMHSTVARHSPPDVCLTQPMKDCFFIHNQTSDARYEKSATFLTSAF